MQQILVYADSLTWGIIPNTRARLSFDQRWPGRMERELTRRGQVIRVIEDALNGRRTVWDDPFKPGRNGLVGLEQRIEVNSPLALVILMLGTNDFQSAHSNTAWHSAQGTAALVRAIRRSPIEPDMPVPPILLVAPPPAKTPRGEMAEKFAGADKKSKGLARELQKVAREFDCFFFDSGSVVSVSKIDGVHLDADQHARLGVAMAEVVRRCLAGKSKSAASGRNP
jgi:lysophospholipase L1-like esterase